MAETFGRKSTSRLLVPALLTTLLGPLPAQAHSYLKRSDPPQGASLDALPETWKLEFSAKAEPKLCRFTLVSPSDVAFAEVKVEGSWNAKDKQRVDLQLPKLGPGRYELRWSVFATDGHRQDGKIPFSVGAK